MSNISYRRRMYVSSIFYCRRAKKKHSMTGIMSTWSYYYVYQWFRISVAFYRQIDSWAKKQATRERGNHQKKYKATKPTKQTKKQSRRGKSKTKKLRGKICKCIQWHLFLVHSSIFFLRFSPVLAIWYDVFLVFLCTISLFSHFIVCCCSFWPLSQFFFIQN